MRLFVSGVKKLASTFRFDEEEGKILEEIARCCGIKRSEVVRWAIQALGEHFRRNGGRLTLPIDFEGERPRRGSRK